MSKKIRRAAMDDVHGDFKVAYLMGWVAPNGGFVSSGNCFWIRDDPEDQDNCVSIEDIFVEDHDEYEGHDGKEE